MHYVGLSILALIVGCRTGGSKVSSDSTDARPVIMVQKCGMGDDRSAITITSTPDVQSVIAHIRPDGIVTFGADAKSKMQLPQGKAGTVYYETNFAQVFFDRIRGMVKFYEDNPEFNPTLSRWLKTLVKDVPTSEEVESFKPSMSISFVLSQGGQVLNFSMGPSFVMDFSPERPMLLPTTINRFEYTSPIPVEFQYFVSVDDQQTPLEIDKEWWDEGITPRSMHTSYFGPRWGFNCDKPRVGTSDDLPRFDIDAVWNRNPNLETEVALTAEQAIAEAILSYPSPDPFELTAEAAAAAFCNEFVQRTHETRLSSKAEVQGAVKRFLSAHQHSQKWQRRFKEALDTKLGPKATQSVFERLLWNGCVAGQYPDYRYY